MTSKAHIATGAFTALVAYKLGLSHQPLELVLGAVFVSTMPDYDQKIPFLRHRGQTHSLLWPILLCIASGYYSPALLLGACIGWFSHLVIDLFNGKGEEILWPFTKKNYRIADFKYDGVMENVLLGMMCIGIIILIASNFVDVRLIAGIK